MLEAPAPRRAQPQDSTAHPLVVEGTRADAHELRDTATIRARCRALLERARRGDSDAFIVDDARGSAAVAYVLDVVRAIDPAVRQKVHGRMRHFDAGGVARTKELDARLASLARAERARAKIDLVVPSVLLDAGAGPRWRYRDGDAVLGRSEGLAVASFRLFMSGAFAEDGATPRTDAAGLARMDAATLGRWLQVGDENPIVGLEGRAHVLRELGRALAKDRGRFGAEGRPGHLLDWARANAATGAIEASTLLRGLLESLSPIWPGRYVVAGEHVGDVWPHAALGSGAAGLVPFHKLSQWLTYSLVEPLAEGGVAVTGLDRLTRLPEYRNGGLLVDLGVLSLKDARSSGRRHRVDDPLVVEWRALTVALLDDIVPRVRAELRASSDDAGLTSLLEAGTWLAGRRAACERRADGSPPIAIESDGTVF